MYFIFCSFGVLWVYQIRWGILCMDGGIGLGSILQLFGTWSRNRRTFDNMVSSLSQCLEFFVTSLYDWSRVGGFPNLSIVSFIDSLSFCILPLLCNYLTLLCPCFMHTEKFFLIKIFIAYKKKPTKT